MAKSVAAITQMLAAYSQGDSMALQNLVAAVYNELRKIARAQLRGGRGGPTLQPTALVNEAFLRLMQSKPIEWTDRAHFYRVAAKVMRNILIDHFKHRRRLKRGGDAVQVQFDEAIHQAPTPDMDILALDEALSRLAEIDERLAQLVELRYFAGLDLEQTAEVMGCSTGTVKRDWAKAKFWLAGQLRHQAK